MPTVVHKTKNGSHFQQKKKKKIPWALHYTKKKKKKIKEKGYKYFTRTISKIGHLFLPK